MHYFALNRHTQPRCWSSTYRRRDFRRELETMVRRNRHAWRVVHYSMLRSHSVKLKRWAAIDKALGFMARQGGRYANQHVVQLVKRTRYFPKIIP
jgi:hypothetical protein